MSIKINDIQSALVRTINELVGQDACPNRQLFTSPVIKARQGGVRPDYPYVMIGRGLMSGYGHTGKYAEYYDEFGNLVRHTNYRVDIPVSVHGAEEHDVQSIAQTVRDTLFRDYGWQKLFEEYEAGLLDITTPSFTAAFLNTDYEETSQITVSLSVTDVFVEDDPNCPSTGEITSISVDGEVRDYDDDPDPLLVESNAP